MNLERYFQDVHSNDGLSCFALTHTVLGIKAAFVYLQPTSQLLTLHVHKIYLICNTKQK